MKLGKGTTLIHHGRFIDGSGRLAVADAALAVQDGRIRYAGPAAGEPQGGGVVSPQRHGDAEGGLRAG